MGRLRKDRNRALQCAQIQPRDHGRLGRVVLRPDDVLIHGLRAEDFVTLHAGIRPEACAALRDQRGSSRRSFAAVVACCGPPAHAAISRSHGKRVQLVGGATFGSVRHRSPARGVRQGGGASAFSQLVPEEGEAGWRYTLFVGCEPRADWAETLDHALHRIPHYACCRKLGQLQPPNVVSVTGQSSAPPFLSEIPPGTPVGAIKPVALCGAVRCNDASPPSANGRQKQAAKDSRQANSG